MALTEIPIELSSTPSIVDGGNATAITIDSSENVGVGVAPIGTRLNIKAGGNAYTDGALSLTDADSNTRTYITHVNDLFAVSMNDGAGDGIIMSGAGQVTMPSQPAFLARPASNQDNIPINGSTTIVFGTEIFDQGANFASNTFTAPVTGRYQLTVNIYMHSLDTATAYYQLDLITSNRRYYDIAPSGMFAADPNYYVLQVNVLADMDASDTVFARLSLPNSGTAQADTTVSSYFSGYLVA